MHIVPVHDKYEGKDGSLSFMAQFSHSDKIVNKENIGKNL